MSFGEYPSPDFDASAFELVEQRILREEFARQTALNQAAMASFDPTVDVSDVAIVLQTDFPEYEQADPQLTAMRQMSMLRDLGLTPRMLDDEDSSTLFQHMFGSRLEQLHLVEREDGVAVPVAASYVLKSNGKSYAIAGIRLLSYARATERKAWLEGRREEEDLNGRLQDEFGLDAEFLKAADLTLNDKREMLASYDQMRAVDTAQPDTEMLDRTRTRLVRSTMPRTEVAQHLQSDKKKTRRATEYEEALQGLINAYELDTAEVTALLQSERLVRLTALNEQLRARVRNTKIVRVALMGNVVMFFGGMSSFFGYETGGDTEAIYYGLMGVGAGAIAAWDMRRKLRNNMKYISKDGFSLLEAAGGDNDLRAQLAHEEKLAQKYLHILTSRGAEYPF